MYQGARAAVLSPAHDHGLGGGAALMPGSRVRTAGAPGVVHSSPPSTSGATGVKHCDEPSGSTICPLPPWLASVHSRAILRSEAAVYHRSGGVSTTRCQ